MYSKTSTCLVFASLLEVSPTSALIADDSKANDFNHLTDIRFPQNETPVVFRNVGYDYIGPFAVIQWSKEEKAYICLFNCKEEKAYICRFNCLVTRVVHLEVTEDLKPITCKTAIRRFIARRGHPRLLLSDNGSNFLGARKQIRRQTLKLDHELIRQKLLNQSVDWPLTSFCPSLRLGVGEAPTDCKTSSSFELRIGKVGTFSTIVTKTESLVNARALTHVKSDVEDEDPLTPNHFLVGRAFSNVPACVFKENHTVQTNTWVQVRQGLEAILKRLLREYVPTLNARKK